MTLPEAGKPAQALAKLKVIRVSMLDFGSHSSWKDHDAKERSDETCRLQVSGIHLKS
jgi:hypothetical protein